MSSEKYITANGISCACTLPKIKKKEDVSLQRVFEAFTNSLELIKLRLIGEPDIKSKIEIKLFHNRNLFSEQDAKLEFDKLEIIDNGIGLNDKEFQQHINLDGDRKELVWECYSPTKHICDFLQRNPSINVFYVKYIIDQLKTL